MRAIVNRSINCQKCQLEIFCQSIWHAKLSIFKSHSVDMVQFLLMRLGFSAQISNYAVKKLCQSNWIFLSGWIVASGSRPADRKEDFSVNTAQLSRTDSNEKVCEFHSMEFISYCLALSTLSYLSLKFPCL